jgi:DNA-binding response OmpR family regulator
MAARDSSTAGFGSSGSALVAVDDQRAALAAVLVLQEMGLTVDIAADRESALAWVKMARYAAIVSDGHSPERLTDFALRVRAASPATEIILLAPFPGHPTLVELGAHVLQPPVNVNALVQRLRLLANGPPSR